VYPIWLSIKYLKLLKSNHFIFLCSSIIVSVLVTINGITWFQHFKTDKLPLRINDKQERLVLFFLQSCNSKPVCSYLFSMIKRRDFNEWTCYSFPYNNSSWQLTHRKNTAKKNKSSMMWLELLLSLYKVCQLCTFKKAFEVRPTTWKSLYVFIHTPLKNQGEKYPGRWYTVNISF